MRHVLTLTIIAISLWGSKSLASACVLDQVMNAGISVADCEKLETYLREFRRKAEAKAQSLGARFRTIEPHQVLRDLKANNMTLVGFAGRSADFKDTVEDHLEKMATRSVINGILDQLDPKKHVIVHGGTASGFGDLLAKRAIERGFIVLGLTAAAAAKYEPAYMNLLLSTMDPKFGGESSVLVALADVLFVIGSGEQGAREAAMFSFKNPEGLFLVADERIKGSSYKMAEAIPGLIFYRSGSEAAREYVQATNAPLEKLPSRVERLKDISSVRDIFGPSRKVIGVTSFVEGQMEPSQIAKIADHILDNLVLNDVVFAISGTKKGPEDIFAARAIARGADVVALTSESAKPNQFNDNIRIAVPVASSWTNFTGQFVGSLDGIISFGGRQTVLAQLSLAKGKIPFIHISGLGFGMLDYIVNTQFVRDSQGTGFSISAYSENFVTEIEKAASSMMGIPKCILTFGRYNR